MYQKTPGVLFSDENGSGADMDSTFEENHGSSDELVALSQLFIPMPSHTDNTQNWMSAPIDTWLLVKLFTLLASEAFDFLQGRILTLVLTLLTAQREYCGPTRMLNIFEDLVRTAKVWKALMISVGFVPAYLARQFVECFYQCLCITLRVRSDYDSSDFKATELAFADCLIMMNGSSEKGVLTLSEHAVLASLRPISMLVKTYFLNAMKCMLLRTFRDLMSRIKPNMNETMVMFLVDCAKDPYVKEAALLCLDVIESYDYAIAGVAVERYDNKAEMNGGPIPKRKLSFAADYESNKRQKLIELSGNHVGEGSCRGPCGAAIAELAGILQNAERALRTACDIDYISVQPLIRILKTANASYELLGPFKSLVHTPFYGSYSNF
ncbi:hypothetical protein HK101_005878 [Irineochytrium annulatum]|nr:hypothetical protein HK101_005878 [Irineochytrium annulatum]